MSCAFHLDGPSLHLVEIHSVSDIVVIFIFILSRCYSLVKDDGPNAANTREVGLRSRRRALITKAEDKPKIQEVQNA